MEVNTQFASGYHTTYRSASRTASKGTFVIASETNNEVNSAGQTVSEGIYTEPATTEELYYRQSVVSGAARIHQAEIKPEQVKSLGIGFLFVGNIGLGMSASQIMNKDSDDVIVRVKASKGGNSFETFDVNLSEVDPRNASAIEMFAFCQYADANGTGVNSTWGSWHALKEFSTPFGETLKYSSLEDAATQRTDWSKVLSESGYFLEKQSTGETLSAAEVFKMLKETIIEKHKLTSDKIKKEDDWREMDDEQWDKLIEFIDKYIDYFKEELERIEEIREEAAMKAAADAPADMRAAAASKAVLDAMANGIADGASDSDISYWEKISWTYNMQTDDQIILATAKMANEFAPDILWLVNLPLYAIDQITQI